MEMRERIARLIWFGHIDWQGYPNGMPTYDELKEHERERLLYQASVLIQNDLAISSDRNQARES